MTDQTRAPGLDDVRAALGDVEDVDLPEGMTAPLPGDDPHPDSDPYEGMEPDHGLYDAPRDEGAELAAKLAVAAGYQINDLGNGQRFVLHFGPDCMFVPRKGWHVWTGKVWEVDPDMILVRTKAQRLSDLVLAEVPHLVLSRDKMQLMAQEAELRAELETLAGQTDEDGKQMPEAAGRADKVRSMLSAIDSMKASLGKIRTGHRTFARSTGNTAKIKAALTEAEVPLAVKVEALDTRPLDVNVQNGVLRFTVARGQGPYPDVKVELLPHERDLRMTKIMTAAYEPGKAAPRFHAFLDRIMPDRNMQLFLQRWFGYSMLGLTNEQALAFFYGMGANGKSVISDLIANLMGTYAASAKIETLTGTNRRSAGDATPELVNIVAARYVRTSEPEQGVKWQEGLIKQLTGGEPILVRALNENFIEVTPIFKITIQGNHSPDIRGMDDGIWRRLMIVPFDVQIPKEERDPLLGQRLLEEASGILSWMVEGAVSYLEGGLAPPMQVSEATDTLRRDADPYGQFLEEGCVVTGDDGDSISSAELMRSFQFWQMRRGETPFKERTITVAMKEHSRRWRSRRTGKQFTARSTGRFNGYDGLRFTDVFAREWAQAPKDQSGKALGVGRDDGQEGFAEGEAF